MIRILVLYATTHGQTAKVAHVIGETLRSRGAAADIRDIAFSNPDPREYAGVIVAAPIRAGKYRAPIVKWVRSHSDALRSLPSAFVSVCLAVLEPSAKVRQELDAIVRRFEARTGWKPRLVKQVAGALPYTRYGWLTRLVMRRIVKKAGGDTDTSRDYEYTDWADLRGFAGAFYDQYADTGAAAEPACTPDACCCAVPVGSKTG